MHGHLGLVLAPDTYSQIVPPVNQHVNSWVDPVHPGLVPAYPPKATDAQIDSIKAAHKEQIRCWRLCGSVNKALTQQVLNSIVTIYMRALRNPNTGYASLHICDLLWYLFTNYGRIVE